MFLWTKPKGLKVFNQSLEMAKNSQVLAANQGLYNGFLATGLLWGFFHPTIEVGLQIKYFFLACVLIAGVFGGITVNKNIFFVQAIPAILGIASLFVFG